MTVILPSRELAERAAIDSFTRFAASDMFLLFPVRDQHFALRHY